MAKRQFAAVLVILLAAVALFSYLWLSSPRSFDKTVWLDDAKQGSGDRQAMADLLLSQGTLQGLTRMEVIDRLGEPFEGDHFANWDLVYWLGLERGFIRIDSEWLVIRFGADGRVAEARLVTD